MWFSSGENHANSIASHYTYCKTVLSILVVEDKGP